MMAMYCMLTALTEKGGFNNVDMPKLRGEFRQWRKVRL